MPIGNVKYVSNIFTFENDSSDPYTPKPEKIKKSFGQQYLTVLFKKLFDVKNCKIAGFRNKQTQILLTNKQETQYSFFQNKYYSHQRYK